MEFDLIPLTPLGLLVQDTEAAPALPLWQGAQEQVERRLGTDLTTARTMLAAWPSPLSP